MCAEGKVCGATTHFTFLEFFQKMYVMSGTSELSVKTCCHLWEDGDTPPVLKESDLHFRSERNEQRIDTLNIEARRKFHHRNTSRLGTANHARHCCHLPLRIPHVLGSLQTPGPGNAKRRTQPEETYW